MKKLDVKAYKLHKLADYIGVIFLVMLLLFYLATLPGADCHAFS